MLWDIGHHYAWVADPLCRHICGFCLLLEVMQASAVSAYVAVLSLCISVHLPFDFFAILGKKKGKSALVIVHSIHFMKADFGPSTIITQ